VLEKLRYFREQYPYYLGRTKLTRDIQWTPANPHNILVPNPEGEFEGPTADANGQLNEVELAVIGQISKEGFFFYPSGNYQPGSKFDTPLSKQKASLRIQFPENLPNGYSMERDWKIVRYNVNAIQNMALSGDRQPHYFWVGKGDREGIRVSHALFEVFPLLLFSATVALERPSRIKRQ
jgi:hypothetical protein